MPRNPSFRTPTAVAVAIAVGVAALYAVLAFIGDALPDAIEGAFSFAAVRWVLLAVCVLGLASVLGLEARMRAATKAYVDEIQMQEDLIRRAEDAVALTEANRGLNRASPEDLMIAIARGAAVTVGAKDAIVYTYEEDRDVMVPVGWTGEAGPIELSMEEPPGRTALSKQPLLSNDPPPPALTAPVIAGDELVAVIMTVAKDKRFGDRELRLLVAFAAEAAVAVTRARAIVKERGIAERLSQIDRAKSDFVAAVTHELKTPLTSLLGYASILRKRMDALPLDRREQFFEIMQRQGERILKLIGELLESSRMESGLAKMQRKPIDLAYILETVVTGMRPAAKRHTIEVRFPEQDPAMWGDPSALEHILTNLIDNAIKYSPAKTLIRVWVEVETSEISINVADEGRGIPAEDLPFIFERFRQGETVERSRSSVGLGLFIVRSLVEAQGGSVSATSEVGKGSTFTVAFPRRAERRAPIAEAAPVAESTVPDMLPPETILADAEPLITLGEPEGNGSKSPSESELPSSE